MRRLTKVRRCCFIPGKPSLLERRRGMEQQRKRAKRAAPHLSMMARGGRENGAKRRNPNQPNHIKRHSRQLEWRFCLLFPHIFPTRKFVSPLIFITFVKLNHLFTSLIVYGATVKIIRL